MNRVVRGVTVAALVALGATVSPGIPSIHAAGAGDGDIGRPSFLTGSPVPAFRTDRTIPYWSSSFSYGGVNYPYTMVGTNPANTSTQTTIPTEIIPIRLDFANGYSLDGGGAALASTLGSPNFVAAPYSTGTTQFANAVQRASFWNEVSGSPWGVLLGTPTAYPTVTFNVPAKLGTAFIGQQSGQVIAYVDATWFTNRLGELMGSLHLSSTSLPIFQTTDVALSFKGGCCALGYHAALRSLNGNGNQQVQTFIWASYLLPGVSSAFGDVTALSHEISEWMNDPFVNNAVPPWLALGPYPFCQNNLETGDPLENLPNAAYPVTIDGTTYHPQSEVLLSWFTRQVPSTGIGGAYSYPDTSLATEPSAPC